MRSPSWASSFCRFPAYHSDGGSRIRPIHLSEKGHSVAEAGEHMSEAQERPQHRWGPDACRAALNAELYPQALLEIADSGHELGYHGWRHEYWPNLSLSDEVRLLERGVHRMQEIGVGPNGFRPPGGRLTPSSPKLLENLSFTHCSPAGRGTGFLDSLVVLPFAWQVMDAYHYLPRFGGLRESFEGSDEPLSPARFRKTLGSALRGIIQEGGHLTLIFHPFLEEQEDRFEIMRGALEELRVLVKDHAVWCAPHGDVASWVRNRAGGGGDGLELDSTEA